MEKDNASASVVADALQLLIERGAVKPADLAGAVRQPASTRNLGDIDTDGPLRAMAAEAVAEHRRKCAVLRLPVDVKVRINGPSRTSAGRYRWTLGTKNQRTHTKVVPTRAEADRLKELLAEQLAAPVKMTVGQALAAYREDRQRSGLTKENSERTTFARLHAFFTRQADPLVAITPAAGAALYRAQVERAASSSGAQVAVSTHRNTLQEAKRFLDWAVTKRFISANPLREVKAVGRRSHGKDQLRLEEAARLYERALVEANKGDAGAVAVLLCLLCGLRAGEVLALVCRDIDAGDVCVVRGKTQAARRRVRLPAQIAAPLELLRRGRPATERLLGDHADNWVLRQTHRFCKLCKIQRVSAHSLRGLHSSEALASGLSARAVADTLGHRSPSTTKQSYARPGAVAEGAQQNLLKRLHEALQRA